MRFEEYNISPEIKKNLSKLSFKRPTDIQFKSIPSILKGEDVLAIVQKKITQKFKFFVFYCDKVMKKHKVLNFSLQIFLKYFLKL